MLDLKRGGYIGMDYRLLRTDGACAGFLGVFVWMRLGSVFRLERVCICGTNVMTRNLLIDILRVNIVDTCLLNQYIQDLFFIINMSSTVISNR